MEEHQAMLDLKLGFKFSFGAVLTLCMEYYFMTFSFLEVFPKNEGNIEFLKIKCITIQATDTFINLRYIMGFY